MWSQIIVVSIFLSLLGFSVYYFIEPLFVGGLNALIVYLILYREYFVLKKQNFRLSKDEIRTYIMSLLISLVIMFLIGSVWPIWRITLFIVIAWTIKNVKIKRLKA